MRPRPKVPVSTPETRPPRAPVPVRGIRATVSSVNGLWTFSGWVRTLGTGGMRVESDSPMPPDTEVGIEFLGRVGERAERFSLLGWSVYRDADGVALQFDPATVTHPERLAELVACYLDKPPPAP
ncbi:MAG: hypothetical protein OEY97_01965 [Nitrospirota bacterium]|nr:hypothetical protein [Nitrospirota bacterium]